MKSKIFITIALLALPALAYAQSGERAKYINYKYKGVLPESTLPNGVKHLGGGLIGDFDADPVYGVSQVQKGKTKMLWLEVSTGQDERGVTGWQVMDVLAFPLFGASDYLFFGGDPTIECKRGGKDIPNLVGIGRILPRQGIFKPTKLWVASVTTNKFEPTPVAGVRCVYSEP